MVKVMDRFRMDGKVVVITGGAGLLGKKHGDAVAEAGGTPVLIDLDESAVAAASKEINDTYGINAMGLHADITQRDQLETALSDVLKVLGGVDVLINNAANNPKMNAAEGEVEPSRFECFSQEIWEKDIAVGLTGAYLCSQVFGGCMAEKNSGVILNVASDLGLIAPDQRIYRQDAVADDAQPVKPVTYSVVKHGLIGLTRYLATYWAESGIRVNALCPGGVYQGQAEDFVKKLTHLIPMGRMADDDEYQSALIFLISDASSYMTGSVVTIDGGRTCW